MYYLVRIYINQDRTLNIKADDYSITSNTGSLKTFIYLYRDVDIISAFDLNQIAGFLAMEEEGE